MEKPFLWMQKKVLWHFQLAIFRMKYSRVVLSILEFEKSFMGKWQLIGIFREREFEIKSARKFGKKISIKKFNKKFLEFRF